METGQELFFMCVSGTVGSTYKFMKDGVLVDEEAGGDNKYLIPSASPSNSGTYSCHVTINGVDSPESTVAVVNVYGK